MVKSQVEQKSRYDKSRNTVDFKICDFIGACREGNPVTGKSTTLFL